MTNIKINDALIVCHWNYIVELFFIDQINCGNVLCVGVRSNSHITGLGISTLIKSVGSPGHFIVNRRGSEFCEVVGISDVLNLSIFVMANRIQAQINISAVEKAV